MTNNFIKVFEKVTQRDAISLEVDAVYQSDPKKINMDAEVLSKLMGVKNQGGFRYKGKTAEPYFVVIYSTGEDIDWKDELDITTGIFLYYGDNKTAGKPLHTTNLHGNEILRYIFDLASSSDFEKRKKIPPVFVFKKYNGRDVQFLGLAVPGNKDKTQSDWLTAVWGANKTGGRFQNYKAYFTILNTSNGINLAWLTDIENENAYGSPYAPGVWKKFVKSEKYYPLIVKPDKVIKTKDEQLPDTKQKMDMLHIVQDFFIKKDNGYSFEELARDIIKAMDSNVAKLEVTRKYKDGGVDGVGKYKIFENNPLYVDFVTQAKCYDVGRSVSVKDTARLISRIKNREFGIMITTSFVAQQAYEEVIEDGHPIIFITGKDIIEYLFYKVNLKTENMLNQWLIKNYSKV